MMPISLGFLGRSMSASRYLWCSGYMLGLECVQSPVRTINISGLIQVDAQDPARREREDEHIVGDLGGYEVGRYGELERRMLDVEHGEGCVELLPGRIAGGIKGGHGGGRFTRVLS